MAEWLDTIIQGVLLGGLYALFAAGLSLIFGIMRLVNLAHGDLIVLAAFAILALGAWLGLDPFLAHAARDAGHVRVRLRAAASCCSTARSGRDILPPLLVTFGLSIIIQNGLLEAFSADSQRLRSGAIETASIPLGGGIAFGVMPLITLVSAVAVILALNLLFYRTALGRAFRATSDDLEIAQLMGIDHRRIFALAMGIAMVVMTIAALYLGMRANFDPTIGPARLLYAFEAVIIGGLGSLWGTLAGGIIIGLAQTIGAHINPEWQILAGPPRLPDRAGAAAARPVPARLRLRRAMDSGRSTRQQNKRQAQPAAGAITASASVRSARSRRVLARSRASRLSDC